MQGEHTVHTRAPMVVEQISGFFKFLVLTSFYFILIVFDLPHFEILVSD